MKLLPDEKWVWIPRRPAAVRLAAERRFDVLVSLPSLVGSSLAARASAAGVPWVAHFSDPWTNSPPHGHAQQRIWARIEQRGAARTRWCS
jgi:hypothetical protein